MKSKSEAIELLGSVDRDPHRQGNQSRISFMDFDRLQAFKASLFRDGRFSFVGSGRNVEKGWAPGVWTFRSHDGFAKAHMVFDWRRGSRDAFVTVELEGEPVWIDRKPFRADIHQFMAMWAAVPDEVKAAYRKYAQSSEVKNAGMLIRVLDGLEPPAYPHDAQAIRSEREVVQDFLSDFDGNDDSAEITVEDWKALDGFKQSLFATADGVVFETARPKEESGQWTWKFRSGDGFAHGAFIVADGPNFYATVWLDGEPFWHEYDPNEANEGQIRAIYAMLPEDAKRHIREVAVGIDPEFYRSMAGFLLAEGPDNPPSP